MKKIMVFVSIIIAMFLTGCESNTEWSEPEVTSLSPIVYGVVEETVLEETVLEENALYETILEETVTH